MIMVGTIIMIMTVTMVIVTMMSMAMATMDVSSFLYLYVFLFCLFLFWCCCYPQAQPSLAGSSSRDVIVRSIPVRGRLAAFAKSRARE